MSFSTDMASLVTAQLARFMTLNRRQLAGQAANLDFWLAQIRHALKVLDDYGVRFLRMAAAQEQYIAAPGSEPHPYDDGIFPRVPPATTPRP